MLSHVNWLGSPEVLLLKLVLGLISTASKHIYSIKIIATLVIFHASAYATVIMTIQKEVPSS